MAIVAKSEINEIELRHGRKLVKAVSNILLVSAGRGGRRGDVSRHAVYVVRGHWNVAQESLDGHPIIALGVIGADVALVSPEEVDFFPVNAGVEGVTAQQFVYPSRGVSARECDSETTADFY